jgi:serine/threonine protein phosphatase PrpC
MSNSINYITSTLKGIKSKENKDEFLVIEEDSYNIFAVFDGVSNARNGKEAASRAKTFIESNYKLYLKPSINIKKFMYDLNQYLVKSDLDEPYTTYCLVYIDKNDSSILYSWLGDSRIYIITSQYMEAITKDDSFKENVLSKYLGNPDLPIEDFRQKKTALEHSHILICTDGFYRLLEMNPLTFFDNFLKKSVSSIRSNIDALVTGNNLDDSTYIFVK